jgi:hypothetical protein
MATTGGHAATVQPGPERVSAPPIRNILLRLSGRGALAKLHCGFASVMRPSMDALGAPTKPCTAWFCPRKARFFAEQKMRPHNFL